MGGQYRRIFGSKLAVFYFWQYFISLMVGPIQKLRVEYSSVLPDLKSVIIYLLYDQALASSNWSFPVTSEGLP